MGIKRGAQRAHPLNGIHEKVIIQTKVQSLTPEPAKHLW